MKTKHTIAFLSFLILNSCIVKSLHPFYTKETIVFDTNFLGKWEDNSSAQWQVTELKDDILEGKSLNSLSKEDYKLYKKYQYAYKIVRIKKNKKTVFLAVPFKIKEQMFLDFTPLEYETDLDVQMLFSLHLISVHSLVKYDLLNKREINFKWLDEDKVKTLFEEKRIKIKHEKIGVLEENYLLTAKSEELQKFIKKYITSSDIEKWETSTELKLTKLDE